MIKNNYKKLKEKVCTKYPGLYFCIQKQKLFVKFFIALCTSGLVDLVALFIFYEILGLNIIVAASFAFSIAFFIGFYLQRLWVFNDNDPKKENEQMLLFLALGFVKMSVNAYFMYILVEKMHFWYLFAQLLISLVLAFATYLFEKFVIFRKNNSIGL